MNNPTLIGFIVMATVVLVFFSTVYLIQIITRKLFGWDIPGFSIAVTMFVSGVAWWMFSMLFREIGKAVLEAGWWPW